MNSKILSLSIFLSSLDKLIYNIFSIFLPRFSYSFFANKNNKKKNKNNKNKKVYDEINSNGITNDDDFEEYEIDDSDSSNDDDDYKVENFDSTKEEFYDDESKSFNEDDFDSLDAKPKKDSSKKSKKNKSSKANQKNKKNKNNDVEDDYLLDKNLNDESLKEDFADEEIKNSKYIEENLDFEDDNDFDSYDSDQNNFDIDEGEKKSKKKRFSLFKKKNKNIEDDQDSNYFYENKNYDDENDDNYESNEEIEENSFPNRKNENKSDYYSDQKSEDFFDDNENNNKRRKNKKNKHNSKYDYDENRSYEYSRESDIEDNYYDDYDESGYEKPTYPKKRRNREKYNEYDDYRDGLNRRHDNGYFDDDNDDYYYDDEYYVNDWESRYFGRGSKSENDYYNENFSDNNFTLKKQRNPKKNRKTLFSIFTSIICCIAMIGAGFSIWAIVKRFTSQSQNSSDSNDSGITRKYQTDTSKQSAEAMKYISSRTLSLHFDYNIQGDSNHMSVTSGTGWIFNKEKNSDIYYIATNIHVAAALTYENKTVSSDGNTESYGTFKFAEVGFVNSNSTSPLYNDANVTYVGVAKPTIVYMTTNSSTINNSLNYKESSSTSNSTFESSYQSIPNSSEGYTGVVDFAILKYDFSEKSLKENLSSSSKNKSEKISAFRNWLTTYDTNPTQFYDQPITVNSNGNAFGKKYFMGGFPSINSSNEWVGLSMFDNAADDGNPVTKNNYTNFASAIPSILSTDSDYSSKNYISYYSNSNTLQKLVNVGLFGLFNANSVGGSSGSMVVINDGSSESPNFKVIGIYWGALTFETGSQTKTFGASNYLNVADYSVNGTSYNGYNLFQEATNAIKKSSGNKTLLYNYGETSSTSNSSNSSYYSSILSIDSYYQNLNNSTNYLNLYIYKNNK